MPEGPEIRRAADSLEAAVKGEPLTDVWFAFPQLQVYQAQLVGQRITHIETRGKALLTHFSDFHERPLAIEGLALFREPSRGADFTVHSLFPLAAGANRKTA